jgi:hypothetical protein
VSRNARWPWLLNSALLSGLALYLFHSLIFKSYAGASWALAAWLAFAFVLIVVNREIARGTHPEARSRSMNAWAAMDGVDLANVVFFFALLLVFDAGYLRATADGREYFAQVRSLVIDGDLDFANENALFRSNDPGIFPFGSAVLWLPFFVVAHLWLGILNLAGGELSRNGFANPYQMAIGLGTLIYGFAGLLMIQRIARDYFDRKVAAIATVSVTLGSFIVWYLAVESSYSHGNSLFATTLFLFVWYRTRRDRRSRSQWAWLGLAGALMTMVRWQNALFLVFALADGIGGLWRTWRGRRELRGAAASRGPARLGGGAAGGAREPLPAPAVAGVLAGGAAFAAAFVIGFLPQLVFWKLVYGGWLAMPDAQSGQQWWADSLMVDVLFSANHGLFAWSPVVFLAVLGVPLFLSRDFRFGGLLALVFAVQVYVNGAVGQWWGGHAFGARRFSGCALLFALGLAALITWARKRPLKAIGAALLVLVAGNAFLIADIKAGALPTGEGIAFDQMLGAAYRRIGNPFSFPASWWLGRRYGMSPWQYDQLGLRTYNNLIVNMGAGAGERFLGRGWSAPESGPGGPYRWATGPESVLVAPLKAPDVASPGQPLEQADYVVRFRCQPFVFPGAPQQSVELWVNGRLAGRQLLADELRDYQIDVPRRLLHRNLNELSFHYAYWQAPAEIGGGDDRRPLAVRFERIELLRQ